MPIKAVQTNIANQKEFFLDIGTATHENVGDVLWLRIEKLVVANDRLKELLRHGRVPVETHSARHQLCKQ